MFRGLHELTIDNKGRVAIPTRYREALSKDNAGQLVITIDTQVKCLLIYPKADWEDLEQKVDALPSFNSTTRRIQRLLIGHATDVKLDNHARFVVPLPLRNYAEISKQVVLIGQGRKFELWDEVFWNASRKIWLEQQSEDMDTLSPNLMNLSL